MRKFLLSALACFALAFPARAESTYHAYLEAFTATEFAFEAYVNGSGSYETYENAYHG